MTEIDQDLLRSTLAAVDQYLPVMGTRRGEREGWLYGCGF